MSMAHTNRTSYVWLTFEDQFKPLALQFERIRLAGDRGPEEDGWAWGLTAGAVMVHPVVERLPEPLELDLRECPWWRVSHRESGGGIADFEFLEAALGFAGEVQGLDWSGTREQADEIGERNRAPVLAAYRRWSRLGTEVGEGGKENAVSDTPEMVRVWRVTPDPDGIFEQLIVGSAEQAGEAAARGAELSWDDRDGDPTEPGEAFAIDCFEMSKGEFEALPEP